VLFYHPYNYMSIIEGDWERTNILVQVN